MFGKCDTSCKDCVELALKVIFVAVFTYGVMSAVCCMKSCDSNKSCCTTTAQACSKTAVPVK
tara:strand:- start:232 stop:417 length:186 start_codon:yes stop_codon:yes gene_type:complete